MDSGMETWRKPRGCRMQMMRIAIVTVLASLGLLLTGCGGGGGYGPVTVRVGLDDQFAASQQVGAIEVDVVGLTESQAAVYQGLTLGEYWRQQRPAAAKQTFTFSDQDTAMKSVERNADIWSGRWSGVTKLAILARMTVPTPAAPGDADARIEFIELDTGKWPRTGVEFRVGPNGLRRVTQPRDAT